MEVPQSSRMGSQEHEVCPCQGTLPFPGEKQSGRALELEECMRGQQVSNGPARDSKASFEHTQLCSSSSSFSSLPTLALSSAHSFCLSFCRLHQTAPVW